MIHTVDLYTNITKEEKEAIELQHNKGIKRILRDLENSYKHFKLRIGKPMWNKSYNIYLHVDLIELLEKTDGVIVEEDYTRAQYYIEQLEHELFRRLNKHFILNRLDYRLDVRVNNPEHRACLFKLWNKLAHKYGHLNKRTKKKVFTKKDGKDVYVHSKQFKTTMYIASKSLAICVYDKEAERTAKKEAIKAYEKNVIRFEVRLMTRHLAYKARKKKINRTLKAYFTNEIYKQYIQKYVLDIFGIGHFYKINKVREKLLASKMTAKQQENLITFLKDVSKKGVEGVLGYRKQKNKNGYSRYLVQKYKKLLDELEMNMIMLPIRTQNTGDILVNPLHQVHLEYMKPKENMPSKEY